MFKNKHNMNDECVYTLDFHLKKYSTFFEKSKQFENYHQIKSQLEPNESQPEASLTRSEKNSTYLIKYKSQIGSVSGKSEQSVRPVHG